MAESTSNPHRSLNPLSHRQSIKHVDSNSKAVSTPLLKSIKDRDFLTHLETYLAKHNGIDKFIKISRYAVKIALSSSLLPQTSPLHPCLKSFESNIGLSQKALCLSKLAEDLNVLCAHHPISLLTYGSEGLYYFIEQLVWLSKTGLIDHRQLPYLQKISA
ncbi:hypothetical protein MRB53_026344 [Persea americana]|uniref:Uncharacterized protein n=1 Tax=Persea americana TaxID=3435 RepID=A0ACC2LI38_PERAE|nr:hypothetical protein MRB53_026344 [Persea americana]